VLIYRKPGVSALTNLHTLSATSQLFICFFSCKMAGSERKPAARDSINVHQRERLEINML
jgi:hypothetical protein